jgi:hypothetical protein
MPKRHSPNCHRCGAVLLQDAEVCSACCAPQNSDPLQTSLVARHEPVAVTAPTAPAEPTTRLGAWPFGQADSDAAAQVAARAAMADVRNELSAYSAQTSTHVLAAVPAQRPAQPSEEAQSVPSVGPNPFLAAARLQQARNEADAVEGYPV